MRRNVIVTSAVVLAVLALGAQLAIPAFVSSRVEDRLTEHGGSAHVEIHAFPATDLLGGGGDRLKIRGNGLRFDLPAQDEHVFRRMDKFDEVDTELTDFRAGPFAVGRFTLTREKPGRPYRLTLEAQSTARELTEYGGGLVAGPLGDFVGGIGGRLLPLGDEPIPVSIDAQLRSDNGQAKVIDASGDIAGIPAGPFAEALAGAVAAVL
jgi:hypothetical protein